MALTPNPGKDAVLGPLSVGRSQTLARLQPMTLGVLGVVLGR